MWKFEKDLKNKLEGVVSFGSQKKDLISCETLQPHASRMIGYGWVADSAFSLTRRFQLLFKINIDIQKIDYIEIHWVFINAIDIYVWGPTFDVTI